MTTLKFKEEQKKRFLDTGLALNIPEKLLTSTNRWEINPYHNSYHMQSVALLAFEGAITYKLEHPLQRALFLAGAYHDAGHSLGKTTDAVNVQKAAALFKEDSAGILSEGETELVTQLILSTEFPGVENTLYSFPSSVLRDSDLLVWCTTVDARKWMAEGLSKESGHPVTDDSTRLFLRSAAFHTGWGLMKVMNSELFSTYREPFSGSSGS